MKSAEILKYLKDSTQMIGVCVQALHKVASERDALKEAAKTVKQTVVKEPVALNADALHKAASAIHEVYGKPSQISVEQIEECWKNDPNSLVQTINKLASVQLDSVVSGNHLGGNIKKQSSAEENEAAKSADEIFWARY